MRPRVVWAAQAETLLENLAASKAWRMEVAKLGDHEGRMESDVARLPPWDGRQKGVEHVFVCTPLQWLRARRLFPRAALWWVIHNARGNLIDEEKVDLTGRVVCFSHQVMQLESARHPEYEYSVLQPSYRPTPRWRYSSNLAWTMRNRPQTRAIDAQLIWDAIVQNSQRDSACLLFGQDQPRGFLNANEQAALRHSCSCYLSSLPHWAGFGLAEHEAMAVGCPVVGTWWGDLRAEAPALGLRDTAQEAGALLRQVLEDEPSAVQLSLAGLDYIGDWRSNKRRDASIRRLLES